MIAKVHFPPFSFPIVSKLPLSVILQWEIHIYKNIYFEFEVISLFFYLTFQTVISPSLPPWLKTNTLRLSLTRVDILFPMKDSGLWSLPETSHTAGARARAGLSRRRDEEDLGWGPQAWLVLVRLWFPPNVWLLTLTENVRSYILQNGGNHWWRKDERSV